jgi:beta-lactamase class A
MDRRTFALSALSLAACGPPAPAAGSRGVAAPGSTTPPALGAGLEAAAAAAPGLLGAAVIETSGARAQAAVNGEAAFPMHSTAKTFVAAWAAGEVARGRLADDRTLTLTRETSPPGVGRIDRALEAAGRVSVTVGQMLEAMLLDSDNAAMDGLLSLSPGPAGVADALGLPSGVRMARTLREQYADRPTSAAAYEAWLADLRDTATPIACAQALERLADSRLGGPEGDARVRGLMARSTLGAARIPAGLGPDWTFAGRTGTGLSFGGRTTGTNHVGLATHRTSRRIIVIAAFLRDASGELPAREAALAGVGAAVRAAWPEG